MKSARKAGPNSRDDGHTNGSLLKAQGPLLSLQTMQRPTPAYSWLLFVNRHLDSVLKIPLLPTRECSKYADTYKIRLGDQHLCAGVRGSSKGPCVGDSGGPLQCFLRTENRWVLRGVVSFGAGCADPEFPDIFTNVSHHLGWIDRLMSKRRQEQITPLIELDVDVMKSARKAGPNSTLLPVCLPREEFRVPGNDSEVCYVSGWGRISTDDKHLSVELRQLKIPLLPTRECSKYADTYKIRLGDQHLCAGVRGSSKGPCVGDSGGPLQCFLRTENRWVLRGVVSFGAGCADPEFPDIFTNVSHHLGWIDRLMSKRRQEQITRNTTVQYLKIKPHLVFQNHFLMTGGISHPQLGHDNLDEDNDEDLARNHDFAAFDVHFPALVLPICRETFCFGFDLWCTVFEMAVASQPNSFKHDLRNDSDVEIILSATDLKEGKEALTEIFNSAFKCVICTDLPTHAELCPHCSRMFCRDCFRGNRKKCPYCLEKLRKSGLIRCRWIGELMINLQAVLSQDWGSASEVIIPLPSVKLLLEKIEDTLKCPVCYDTVSDANICPKCTKLFCGRCVRVWVLTRSQTCPCCVNPLKEDMLIPCHWAANLGVIIDKLLGKPARLPDDDQNFLRPDEGRSNSGMEINSDSDEEPGILFIPDDVDSDMSTQSYSIPSSTDADEPFISFPDVDSTDSMSDSDDADFIIPGRFSPASSLSVLHSPTPPDCSPLPCLPSSPLSADDEGDSDRLVMSETDDAAQDPSSDSEDAPVSSFCKDDVWNHVEACLSLITASIHPTRTSLLHLGSEISGSVPRNFYLENLFNVPQKKFVMLELGSLLYILTCTVRTFFWHLRKVCCTCTEKIVLMGVLMRFYCSKIKYVRYFLSMLLTFGLRKSEL
ncbi:unnamed protein product [Notodromas monacha]|uniref:RING-type domain-containing protein n=1 Tax=Notodromas monacha TaxID=399045 RepID=A0A7R9GBM3_9CRUS|nr:unnamed protein product [Notodromas monacha]CAG0915203.1 unnamed protein product [Notodromas monacha]